MTRLSEGVEALYESSFLGRFPYDDCFKLQRQNPSLSHAIVPDLDMYWSFIAGYASSATRLERRPLEELRKAIPRLRRSFFELHPEYGPFEEQITSENVNAL